MSTRATIFALFTACLAGGIGAALFPTGCKGPPGTQQGIRAGYCEITNLSDQDKVDGAVPGDCASCLQTSCCDEYGDCAATPQCEDGLKAEYACLLDAGSLGVIERGACATLGASSPPYVAASACLLDKCAHACSLDPVVCTPDLSTPQVVGPNCDQCVTTYCCTELAQCNGSRECRLAFSCITQCGPDLVSALIDSGTPDQVDFIVGEACAGRMGPSPINSDCINKCVAAYVPEEKNAGVPAQQSAACKSLEIFSCSYAHCRTACEMDVPRAIVNVVHPAKK